MFLADPVLATVPETYLEQSIVLWDCCCVNDPWDVLKVLWNKKLKEVSSLWQKLQGRKCLDDRKSSCKFDWGLAVRFSPVLPLFCSSSPTFFMLTGGGGNSLGGKFPAAVMLPAPMLLTLFSECCILFYFFSHSAPEKFLNSVLFLGEIKITIAFCLLLYHLLYYFCDNRYLVEVHPVQAKK